ncbi:zinc transporter ZIP11 isoform X2 [Crotalus tigris]|uniref:zinc transporter ZIP11 isoform X2 n=1 Tax=Crotalus tigris TaxID=88082 RepID=UPI00192F1C48|nr:zinc transporter ZIP11 isoform X2 [Crotalus tigris]
MILGYNPVLQALLGTLLTWGLTAAGSALVFIFSSGQRQILDGSLGFAAGVMLAASYWSLLEPAIELAEDSGKFGAFAFLPVAIGFTLGAAFVYLTDLLLPWLDINVSPQTSLALSYDSKVIKEKYEQQATDHQEYENELSIRIDKGENGEPYQRRKGAGHNQPDLPAASQTLKDSPPVPASSSWRRIMLLILAITIHNIPEGLAVGVGFGAVGKSPSATFESARAQEIMLPDFCPNPSHDLERQWHLLEVHRAFRCYIKRTAAFRNSEALFVSFHPSSRGQKVSASTIGRWIRACITGAYQSESLLVPRRVTAHSTNSAATSAAWATQASIEDVCRAATWSSPSPFIRHYKLDKFASAEASFGRGILQ